MTDLNKVLVISAIMGVLLIAGLLMYPSNPEPAPVEPVVEEPVADVAVLPQASLEMLDPIYSEKAVFNDDTVRIAFDAELTEDGANSILPFWIHNLSDDPIAILWDRCSIQLPNGNTVKIINEQTLAHGTMSDTIIIAPKGDLFDAVIPVSELAWEEDGWSVTNGVLNAGAFTFVLAIEVIDCPEWHMPEPCPPRDNACDTEEPCGPPRDACGRPVCEFATCGEPVIAYYTFRFVIR